MQRKGGFEILENNVYYPERYNHGKISPGKGYTTSISQLGNQTTYKLLPFSNSLIERNMCTLHSIGKKAGFVTFVNHLGSTLLSAVEEYVSKFSYEDFRKAVSILKNTSFTEIWLVYDCIADIRDAVNKECISEWGKGGLDEDIKCKGIPPPPA